MNMEPVGAFPDGEWDFSRMFSMEGLDCFAPELPGPYCSFLLEHNEGPHFATASAFCANSGDDVSITTLNPNLHFISQENSSCSNCSSSAFASGSSQETYSFCNSNHVTETSDMPMSMDVCIMDERITRSFAPFFPEIATTGVNEGIANKELELKRKFDSLELKVNSHNDMKKKPRVTRNVQSNKKNADPRKNQKLITPSSNDEEENNPVAEGQSSSSCNSKDDTNASQDSSGGATSECKAPEALNSTRAGRGSAADPQSLYARKRRERINERLRILQNLVPNGTKVDISTMLEEAVHYVKFLQLQIKLLSSDDLWMYAPIAYNGVDIGLNQTISALL